MGAFFFSNDAEKLISWGSRATIIKRYGLEEHTLRSAWVGVCVLLVLLYFLCVGCSQYRWEFVLSRLAGFVCVLERVRPEVDY